MSHLTETLVHKNIQFLKENKIRLAALSFAAATLVSVSLPLATTFANRKPRPTNHNNIVSATETKYALSTTDILSDSDQLATTTDSDSALTTKPTVTDSATVDIPKNAKEGVTFGQKGKS